MTLSSVNARAYDGTNGGVLRVALVYMLTGFATFLAMGVLGLLMRLDQAGVLLLPTDWFYRILTLHGSGMVSAILLAAMGGLAAAMSQTVRLSSRWLWTAYMIYVLSTGFVVLATLVGGFGAGWTVLHPLPYQGRIWGMWAGVVMYVGYLCVALGFLVYCVHVLVATSRSYGGLPNVLAWRYLFSGGRDTSVPLPYPADIAGTVVAINGIVAAVVGAAVLLPLFAQAAGLIGMVDALYAKNLELLFGHSLANLSIYLGAGLVYATLPLYTGRAWRTSWPVVLAWNLVIVLVLLPFSHHMYEDFVQPLPLQFLGEGASYAIVVPAFLVTIFGGLSLIYRSGMRWSVPSILIALGLWGWTFGGMGAVLDSTIAVNQVMHNTLWTPAHFHTYYLLGGVAFDWAYLYYLIGDLSRARETRFSRAAAWLYGIGGAGFVLAFFVSGAESIPRRYATHLPAWQIIAQAAVPFVLILTLGIAWLAIEMLRQLGPAWRQTWTMSSGAER
jgi:cytochrome c oxidase subunit I